MTLTKSLQTLIAVLNLYLSHIDEILVSEEMPLGKDVLKCFDKTMIEFVPRLVAHIVIVLKTKSSK